MYARPDDRWPPASAPAGNDRRRPLLAATPGSAAYGVLVRGTARQGKNMELLDQHRRAMTEFDRRVQLLTEDRWHVGTPCDEWDARDLVNHLVAEQLWVPHLLAGETLDDVGDRYDGDQLGDDPVDAWSQAAAAAREAVTEPGALDGSVHSSMGQLPATEYLAQLISDLAIHAWDLARALSLDEELDHELVEELYRVWAPRADELSRAGVFGSPVDLGDATEEDLQTRLLALFGRDARRG
jgi:uncharacterized protein (TIGR03086 family)